MTGRKWSRWALVGLAGAAVSLWDDTARAKTSWQLVYSQPNSGNALASVAAVDGNNAWTVGVAQQMSSSSPVGLRTTDGVSWVPFSLPQGTGPLDIYLFLELGFHDLQQGWMAGVHLAGLSQQNVLFRTTDGGASWTEAYQPAAQIEQLQALPGGPMFGVGGTTLVRSTDGLSVSESTVAVPNDLALRGVFMLNAECGYAVASTDEEAATARSAVLWSGDGGETWQERSRPEALRLRRLWFVDAELGWAAGVSGDGAGVIARSIDGGRTWASATLPDHPAPFGDPVPTSACEDVRFFDDRRGLALCLACTGSCEGGEEDPTYATVLARSTDGGASWQMDPDYEPVMTAPPFGDMMRFSGMFDMAFPTPNAGYLVGQNNLVLRYVADQPEPKGWGPADCASGGFGGSGTTPPGGDGDPATAGGAEDEGGCGCRLTGSRNAGRAPLVALLGLVAAACAARRRRYRPSKDGERWSRTAATPSRMSAVW